MTTAPKRQPIPFGKYLLLDRVNIGGMAEVWRAKSFGAGGFERLVAIKRILPNIAEDEEFISMFIDEAKITVQLKHANIAQIYELSHIANSYFIAMEYVSGKDMRAVFDKGRKRGEPAPIPLSCYVIAQSCEGLDYAHRAKDMQGRDMNIVHRDVSPQNALISYDGEVKVIDFGIAKAAGKATKTQAGILKGKFGYMSPEQIRGLPLDRRSDVFALGVCLYEMLTGERLFVGDSDFSVLEKVRKVEVLPPSHFNRRIPEQLEKIVMKSLAKDVDERYQYASEIAEDLRKFMYSTGNAFARKDLAAYMKSMFAEDVEKEKSRLQEYAEIKAPEGMTAAAEMGFGVGHVPAPQGGQANPSAVTAMPTMVPPTVGPSATTLPPIVRPSAPPVLGPGGSVAPHVPAASAPRPGMAGRTPSMPRLTAVAPMLTNEKEEHASTVLVDGQGAFNSDTNPGDAPRNLNARNRPGGGDVTTDPGHPAVRATPGGVVPRFGSGADPAMDMRPGPPVLGRSGMPPMLHPTTDTSPTLSAVSPQETVPMLPRTGENQAYEPGGGRRSSLGLILGLGGGGLAVAVAIVIAVFALKTESTGLILLDLPAETAAQAKISINGEPVKVAEFPHIQKTKAGKATVMVSVPGYETLIEVVDVKEGNDFSQLTRKLKKKGTE